MHSITDAATPKTKVNSHKWTENQVVVEEVSESIASSKNHFSPQFASEFTVQAEVHQESKRPAFLLKPKSSK